MGLRQTTPPASEPVTLEEAKNHLKVDIADDDAWITAQISAARTLCEDFLGRAMIEQTFKLRLDEWPCNATINVPKAPISAIDSIEYVDAAGATQTIPSGDYILDDSSDTAPPRIMPAYGKSWPSARCQPNAITVTFKAGYGTAGANVPAPYRLAILMQLAIWYENRQPTPELAEGVQNVLWPTRIYTVP